MSENIFAGKPDLNAWVANYQNFAVYRAWSQETRDYQDEACEYHWTNTYGRPGEPAARQRALAIYRVMFQPNRFSTWEKATVQWAIPTPPPPPTSAVSPTKGILGPHGRRAVKDDGGSRLELGVSDFNFLRQFRQDRGKAEDRAVQHVLHGYTYMRWLAQVIEVNNNGFWIGHEVDPRWSNFDENLSDAVGFCASVGIRADITVCGMAHGEKWWQMGYQRERLKFGTRLGGVASQHVTAIAWADMVNEPWNSKVVPVGARDLHEMEAAFNAATHHRFLTGTGDMWQERDETYEDAWDRVIGHGGSGAVGIDHLPRNQSGTSKRDRPERQGYHAGQQGDRWADNEPIGPGSSSSAENDPVRLRSSRSTQWICRAFATTFHSDAGVRGGPISEKPGYTGGPARQVHGVAGHRER